jgi:hypothetical protein
VLVALRLRVRVTLASAIPEAICRAANLGYLDPGSLDVAAFAADPDTLVVPWAGRCCTGCAEGDGAYRHASSLLTMSPAPVPRATPWSTLPEGRARLVDRAAERLPSHLPQREVDGRQHTAFRAGVRVVRHHELADGPAGASCGKWIIRAAYGWYIESTLGCERTPRHA